MLGLNKQISRQLQAAVLATLLVAGGLLYAARPAEASFPGSNGKLSVGLGETRSSSIGALSVINPDGSGLSELVRSGRPEYGFGPGDAASFSGDSSRVAFVDQAQVGGRWVSTLNVANGDGSDRRRVIDEAAVPRGLYVSDAHLNAAGDRIIFLVGTDSRLTGEPAYDFRYLRENIYSINVDGTGLRNLTSSESGKNDYRGLDVGVVGGQDKVVFNRTAYADGGGSVRIDRTGIFLIDIDGSNLRPIFQGEEAHAGYLDPSLSPDGRQIAFERWQFHTDPSPPSVEFADIYTANIDGSNLRRLTDNSRQPFGNPGGGSTNPEFSPDGTKIAYGQHRVDSGEVRAHIATMNRDGSAQTVIAGPGVFSDWGATPRATTPPAPTVEHPPIIIYHRPLTLEDFLDDPAWLASKKSVKVSARGKFTLRIARVKAGAGQLKLVVSKPGAKRLHFSRLVTPSQARAGVVAVSLNAKFRRELAKRKRLTVNVALFSVKSGKQTKATKLRLISKTK